MGIQSAIVQAGFESKVNKIRGRASCLPAGCAGLIVFGGAIYEMARTMDFSALQSYANAFLKLFGK